jgi:hypothetical protein
MKIEGSCPKITELELTEFESELKAKLPAAYRDFLLAHNGGKPSPGIFDVDIDGFINTTAARRFLCLAGGDFEEYSLRKYLREYRTRLPANLLAIANALSASKVCISVSGSDYGTIYYWESDWEVTEREPDYENVYFLAENFTAFLEILYDDPES